MGLSVVVAGYGPLDTLRRSLEALQRDPAVAEVVVSECSAEDTPRKLGLDFPRVQFLHFAAPRSVPQLRWGGMEYTHEEFVAWLEMPFVPLEGWGDRLLAEHRERPDAPAISGRVSVDESTCTAAEWAYFLCEYGAVLATGSDARSETTHVVGGANASFRREAIEQFVREQPWENIMASAWREQGEPLRIVSAVAQFHPYLSPLEAAGQRFRYGREYGAADPTTVRRLMLALGWPAILAVLLLRLGRDAARQGRFTKFVRSFPWVVWYTSSWTVGEALGRLAGK